MSVFSMRVHIFVATIILSGLAVCLAALPPPWDSPFYFVILMIALISLFIFREYCVFGKASNSFRFTIVLMLAPLLGFSFLSLGLAPWLVVDEFSIPAQPVMSIPDTLQGSEISLVGDKDSGQTRPLLIEKSKSTDCHSHYGIPFSIDSLCIENRPEQNERKVK